MGCVVFASKLAAVLRAVMTFPQRLGTVCSRRKRKASRQPWRCLSRRRARPPRPSGGGQAPRDRRLLRPWGDRLPKVASDGFSRSSLRLCDVVPLRRSQPEASGSRVSSDPSGSLLPSPGGRQVGPGGADGSQGARGGKADVQPVSPTTTHTPRGCLAPFSKWKSVQRTLPSADSSNCHYAVM